MDNLLTARSQMASLAFHIVFASIGIAMPPLMVIAERRWLRTKEEVYLTLAKRWAKGTAILFAGGATETQRARRQPKWVTLREKFRHNPAVSSPSARPKPSDLPLSLSSSQHLRGFPQEDPGKYPVEPEPTVPSTML